MLHAENLYEIVSFFAIGDLDALLLSTGELFQHASKCAERIPTWYFARVEITFWDDMVMLKADREPSIFIMGKQNIIEVLNIALRNSVIGELQLYCNSPFNSPSTVLHSLMPANATLMVETLQLCTQDFNGATDLVDVLDRIRMIKALEMYGRDNGMNFEPVVDYCRQRGVNKFNGQTLL